MEFPPDEKILEPKIHPKKSTAQQKILKPENPKKSREIPSGKILNPKILPKKILEPKDQKKKFLMPENPKKFHLENFRTKIHLKKIYSKNPKKKYWSPRIPKNPG